MQKIKLSILLCFISISLISQNFNFLNVPVFEDGIQLKSAWAGGMNAPQWSSVDLNFDGVKDLYVFDRHGNVHMAFINENNAPGEQDYKYARHWVREFPIAYNYVMMRDYNRDGKMDMFTSSYEPNFGLSGIKVFKGKYDDGLLQFDRLLFDDYEYDIIPFTQNGTVVNKVEVYNTNDYSAIDDLDGDGDLDILTMNSAGTKVLHYKNIALESGYTDDTLLYELADDCWGKFGLSVFFHALVLSSSNSDCAFFQPPAQEEDRVVHGGSTFCTFDADNDGDKELLYGDLIYPTIIYAKNGGNTVTAWMTEQDTMFPFYDVPIDIPDFPAPYNLDINNDGLQDIIISPNLPLGTPDYETAWLFENTGSVQQSEFSLVKKDFLADEMIDVGTGANPAFADVNGDGLEDIVIGNRSEWVNEFGDAYYYFVLLLNIGTATEPVYTVADRDWLDLKNATINTRSFTPAFGDIDNDGDDDLIFGGRWGFIHFAENTAGPNMPMEFAPIQFEWKNINVGANSTPFIYDINHDGLSDLIIGERSGTMNYYPNIGSVGNPVFHPIAEESPNNFDFGKINTQLGGIDVGYSQPFVLPLADGDYLITGSQQGWLMMYKVDPDSLDGGAFELVDGQFGGLREGLISRIAFADINEGEFIETLVGNDRGGLTLFQSPITVNGLVDAKEPEVISNAQALLFPNPTNGFLNIDLRDHRDEGTLSYKIFNTIGALVANGFYDQSPINVQTLVPGVYFIQIEKNNSVQVHRFIKQ